VDLIRPTVGSALKSANFAQTWNLANWVWVLQVSRLGHGLFRAASELAVRLAHADEHFGLEAI